MSKNYDNWERLVAATLRKEHLRQLCHSDSIDTYSSDFSTSLSSTSSFSNSIQSYYGPLSFKFVARITIGKQEPTLVFCNGSPFAFVLHELLMASSQVLGGDKGRTTTFLVHVRENVKIVAKRLKLDNINVAMLEKRIEAIGSGGENGNVAAKVRGYYLSKAEMIIFYDYFPEGNLHQIFKYGEERANQSISQWGTRVNIALSAAKGLAHLHGQSGGKFVHGNVKASNIFLLISEEYACVGDPISKDSHVSRYNLLEILSTEKVSQALDVRNFGVVLVLLLSGKSPTSYSTGKQKAFADWVRYQARRDWPSLVSDTFVFESWSTDQRHRSVYEGTQEMLEIALYCVRTKPEERPSMEQVVQMLVDLCRKTPVDHLSAFARLVRQRFSH